MIQIYGRPMLYTIMVDLISLCLISYPFGLQYMYMFSLIHMNPSFERNFIIEIICIKYFLDGRISLSYIEKYMYF